MFHYGKAASEQEWEEIYYVRKAVGSVGLWGQGKLPGRLVSPGKDSGMLQLGWAHPESPWAWGQEGLRLLDAQSGVVGYFEKNKSSFSSHPH